MAQSRSSKKLFNMAYGLGASIVILGALFKILHWELGPLNGGLLLAIGLITEAIIFAISAFEPVDDDLDWSLVYPELAGGAATNRKAIKEPEDSQGLLSKKLDEMLKEARIDSELMNSLSTSIRSFEGAAKGMAPTAEAMNSTKKYSEEMALAAAQMDSLNSLYKVQIESTSRQAEANQAVAENAEQLKQQMQHLATNLSSLNGVYGGMLSAMTNRN
ncbi:type IX secretion system motor protein PorL/GldL [Aequorivita vladivostokensis]|jgi:gliding motility-associated protein GldL|uniref:Gliding motility protein GldL n=1 Tax=Aequorivita vladivostokensis TaxID=171194 RepID=A0ABR5DM37_9FLAO|nr:gliding motility protein GldL [Aequorivita vladivostokensis]MAB57017.1 gliding motility protein GldL [Aequorivita sp.]KJJ39851.1 gliding motility protein GldL [Aequorivita vladivostokensis]MBF32290.1 gliding motility protein GldL [Aequorivita sp.]MDX1783168.1 gliding motility protein GldL [Aequorivita vladivostokensis]HAV55716.1 gliding motility protein GldL [Aequorivita sp.]|tara:strand:- start:10201 stop:10851 length:651 start_codon:yes stop_codon:yes gene_type:complete